MLNRSSVPTRVALPTPPFGLEIAGEYLADVLAREIVNGDPAVASRDVEEAARQLARAARRAGLPQRTVVTWLVLIGAVAIGGMTSSVGLTRQLNTWAADEFDADASPLVA